MLIFLPLRYLYKYKLESYFSNYFYCNYYLHSLFRSIKQSVARLKIIETRVVSDEFGEK